MVSFTPTAEMLKSTYRTVKGRAPPPPTNLSAGLGRQAAVRSRGPPATLPRGRPERLPRSSSRPAQRPGCVPPSRRQKEGGRGPVPQDEAPTGHVSLLPGRGGLCLPQRPFGGVAATGVEQSAARPRVGTRRPLSPRRGLDPQ